MFVLFITLIKSDFAKFKIVIKYFLNLVVFEITPN